MELRHLRHFLAVAETSHFGRAAEQLHLAQPALSQSVRQLEAELGVTLLARTTRHVRLTPAGAFFRTEAQRLLDGLDGALRGVRRIADGKSGLVRIAFTGTAAFDQLPRIAHAIQQDLPDIALEVHADQLTPAQVDGLRAGQLDLAVLRPPVAGDDIEVRRILTEDLVLALPADHRLAGGPAVHVGDVAHDEFVMYSSANSAVNQAVLRSTRAAGFVPRQGHEAPTTSVLLAMVAAGLGVALVPASARALSLQGAVLRDVAGAATIELSLAWVRAHPSPLVFAVVDVLERHGLLDGLPTLGEVS